MSYRLQRRESVSKGMRRIATEQTDKAIAELVDPELTPHKTVHQLRKRCKKIRGLVRLVRPALGDQYQIENKSYRDIARKVSSVRDKQVLLETWKSFQADGDMTIIFVEPEYFGEVAAVLEQMRDHTAKQCNLDESLCELELLFRQARSRIENWSFSEDAFRSIYGGLKQTYDRGYRDIYKILDTPHPANEQLHEWRKRTKYHWYHLRLLRPLWKKMLNVHIRELSVLSELLGYDHDLAVFRQTVIERPGLFGEPAKLEPLLSQLQNRRQQIQRRALSLGMRIYAEMPNNLADRFEKYWDAWQQDNPRLIAAEVQLSEKSTK